MLQNEMLEVMTLDEIIEYMEPYKRRKNILSKEEINWWEISKQNDIETCDRVIRVMERELLKRQ